MRSRMKKIAYRFCSVGVLLNEEKKNSNEMYNISNPQPNIAIASPMLPRAVWECRRPLTMNHPKTSAILSHQIYIANIWTRMLGTIIFRCVADVFATFQTLLYLTECLPIGVCCSAQLGDISTVVGDQTSVENSNACSEFFLDVPMPW